MAFGVSDKSSSTLSGSRERRARLACHVSVRSQHAGTEVTCGGCLLFLLMQQRAAVEVGRVGLGVQGLRPWLSAAPGPAR